MVEYYASSDTQVLGYMMQELDKRLHNASYIMNVSTNSFIQDKAVSECKDWYEYTMMTLARIQRLALESRREYKPPAELAKLAKSKKPTK